MLSESYVRDRTHVETTPMSRLACAVIERAITDLNHVCGCGPVVLQRMECLCAERRQEALEFLTQGDEDLAFWCERAGLDPQAVRERYAHRVAPLAD